MDDQGPFHSRRHFVATGALLALAGCNGFSSGDENRTDTETAPVGDAGRAATGAPVRGADVGTAAGRGQRGIAPASGGHPRYGATNGLLEQTDTGYRAWNLLTDETIGTAWANDALQWLHDTLADVAFRGVPIIDVAGGVYEFDDEVLFTEFGTSIRGPNHWHGDADSAVEFVAPRGEWSGGDGILVFGDENDTGGRQGLVEGLRIKVNDAPRGILGRGASGLVVRHCKVHGVDADSLSIDIAGGSNVTWEHVNCRQAAVHNAYNSKHETNSFTADTVFVKAANAGVPAFQVNGDGWVFDDVIVNAVDSPNLSVPVVAPFPEPGANVLEIRWSGGFLVGVAPVLLDGPTRMDISGVRFVGGETAIRNPNRVTVVGCGFNGCDRVVDTTNGVRGVVLAGNRFEDVGTPSADGLIELNAGNGYWDWVVANNTVLRNECQYDVVLGYRRGSAAVTGNALEKGVDERMPNAPEKSNTVVNNAGYNPVLDRRPTPPLPDDTGDPVANDFGQAARVHHDGTGAFVLREDGQRIPFPTGAPANPVTVPANGQVGFASATPDEWLWLWE